MKELHRLTPWNLLAKSGMSEDNLQALTALLKK